MSNISKIKVGNTTYDIEDTVARASGGGLSADVKQALLTFLSKCALIDANGQTYYNALENALYPPANLSSISAVYTQSGAVYDSDSLDSLRSDLVVTATYDDSSTAIVTNYTLSGTLTVGTSTITVTFGGKTTTFTVTVNESRNYIVATQGNDFIASPTSATNRCSVRVYNRRVVPQDTLSVGCASGYSVWRYSIYADSNASDNGTLGEAEKNLHTKVISDTNESIANDDIKNNVSPAQGGTRTWTTAGATTLVNTGSSGLTVGVVGFIIKKTDDSDITPTEAANAVIITGHTPL